MKKHSFALIIILIAAYAGVQACGDKNESTSTPADTTATGNNDPVKRGEYLVSIMGCDDCHTPKKMGANGPEPDLSLRFSGHPAASPLGPIDTTQLKDWLLFNQSTTAFVGPWGASFAANLTPDDTGIGKWTEGQFLKAIREGKYKGLDNSRPLLPPMPWPSFRNATDEDLKAIFAYLKSATPVKNLVPETITPDKLGAQSKSVATR